MDLIGKNMLYAIPAPLVVVTLYKENGKTNFSQGGNKGYDYCNSILII